jgi:hypothetical protein
MLLPRPRFMTFTLLIAIGYTEICPGSAQSRICGKAHCHLPFNLHLWGAMSLHLIGAATALITKLIGSTNTWVMLSSAGILLVQLVLVLGVTSVAWHLVTWTVAPLRVTWCPLPNTYMRLYGFSAPVMLSSLVCAMCL